MGAVFSQCPKNCDLPKNGQFSAYFDTKKYFLGQMTILAYKTIFGPTFSAILENLLETFFRNVPKTAILAKFGQNENFSQKKGLCYYFTLIVPRLDAKFRKNPWSGFRDQLRDIWTHKLTDKCDIKKPVAFADSIILILFCMLKNANIKIKEKAINILQS